MDLNAPKDEGNFGAMDLVLGTALMLGDEDKNKSDGEIFADAIDTVIGILDEQKDLKKTFVGKNYIPYMAEMKRLGYSRVFAYLVLQQGGDEDARSWLLENRSKLAGFLTWAKTYTPPK